jgi:hypothetical protein
VDPPWFRGVPFLFAMDLSLCVIFLKKLEFGLSCIYSINGGGGNKAKHLYACILGSAQYLKKIVMGQSKWLLDYIFF